MQPLLHVQQLLALSLQHAGDGDAGHLGHQRRDIRLLHRHAGSAWGGLALPARPYLPVLLPDTLQLRLDVGGRLVLLTLHGRLRLAPQLVHPLLEPAQLRGHTLGLDDVL